MIADVAATAQQAEPSTGAAPRKRGRPKDSAELQPPAKRLPDVVLSQPPTWASNTNNTHHASAFHRTNKRSDAAASQPGADCTTGMQAGPAGTAPESSGAAAGDHAGMASDQQQGAEGAAGGTTDAARQEGRATQAADMDQADVSGQASGVQAGSLDTNRGQAGSSDDKRGQAGSSTGLDCKQGRLFGGFVLRGDAELMNQFEGISADAKKVLYMAGKLGMRSDVIQRAAEQLK